MSNVLKMPGEESPADDPRPERGHYARVPAELAHIVGAQMGWRIVVDEGDGDVLMAYLPNALNPGQVEFRAKTKPPGDLGSLERYA